MTTCMIERDERIPARFVDERALRVAVGSMVFDHGARDFLCYESDGDFFRAVDAAIYLLKMADPSIHFYCVTKKPLNLSGKHYDGTVFESEGGFANGRIHLPDSHLRIVLQQPGYEIHSGDPAEKGKIFNIYNQSKGQALGKEKIISLQEKKTEKLWQQNAEAMMDRLMEDGFSFASAKEIVDSALLSSTKETLLNRAKELGLSEDAKRLIRKARRAEDLYSALERITKV